MIYDYNILALVDDLEYVQCFETFNTYPGCDTIRDKLYTYVLGEEQTIDGLADNYMIDDFDRVGVPSTGYSVLDTDDDWPGVWSPDIGLWDIENPPAVGFPTHYKNLSYDNWVVYTAIGSYYEPFDFMQFFELFGYVLYPLEGEEYRMYDFRPIIEPVADIIAIDEPSSLQVYYVFGSEDYQLLSVPVKIDLTVDISVAHESISNIIRDESLVPNPNTPRSAGHDGEYLQSIYDSAQALLSEGAIFNMNPLHASFKMTSLSTWTNKLHTGLVQLNDVTELNIGESLNNHVIQHCGSIYEMPSSWPFNNYNVSVELFLNCPKAVWFSLFKPDLIEFNPTLLEPGKDYIGTINKTGYGDGGAHCPDFEFYIGQSGFKSWPTAGPAEGYASEIEVYGDMEFTYFTTDNYLDYYATTLEYALQRFCSAGSMTPVAGFTFAFTTPNSTEVINSNGEFVDSNFEEIGFKFGVASWDNEGLTDSEVLANIHEDFTSDGTVIPSEPLNGIENWQEVFGPDGNTKGKLTHNYNTPGLKTIHGFVFMYKRGFLGIFSQEDPDGINFGITDSENAIHPLRWKYFRTKINVSTLEILPNDFIEVGGSDFTTIPWNVGKTPILSGISEDSKYVKSIDSSIQSYGMDFIDTKDKVDYADLVIARQNDETGDFLGKVNIEQTRVFIGPKDMNELLMISPASAYWPGGTFGVVDNEWNVLTTQNNIRSLNTDDFPILENRKLDAYIRAYINVTSTDWVVTQFEITAGVNNEEGLAINISAADVNNGAGWQIGLNIIEKDISNVAYYAPGGGEEDPYSGDYNFNRIQVYRTSGTPLIFPSGSPTNVITISNFRIISNAEWEWHPYWDIYDPINNPTGHWGNYESELPNYFDENTCVGTLYINRHQLMDDCILEFNFGELDIGSIPDTSGNANYAIVIGDYGLKKASENLHLRRDTTIKKPKIGSSDKAL